jgi:hypothetical protein
MQTRLGGGFGADESVSHTNNRTAFFLEYGEPILALQGLGHH